MFDLILTKEVSRFARNTLDSLQYTCELLHQGVGVFFVNDNINTLDSDGELHLTIMSGIAQEESRKISERVRFGNRQAMKNGGLFGSSKIYGYVYVDKRFIINEEQAMFVRELFEKFSTGEYSLNQLQKGTATCPSRYIWESEIKQVLFTAFRSFDEEAELATAEVERRLAALMVEKDSTGDI